LYNGIQRDFTHKKCAIDEMRSVVPGCRFSSPRPFEKFWCVLNLASFFSSHRFYFLLRHLHLCIYIFPLNLFCNFRLCLHNYGIFFWHSCFTILTGLCASFRGYWMVFPWHGYNICHHQLNPLHRCDVEQSWIPCTILFGKNTQIASYCKASKWPNTSRPYPSAFIQLTLVAVTILDTNWWEKPSKLRDISSLDWRLNLLSRVIACYHPFRCGIWILMDINGY